MSALLLVRRRRRIAGKPSTAMTWTADRQLTRMFAGQRPVKLPDVWEWHPLPTGHEHIARHQQRSPA